MKWQAFLYTLFEHGKIKPLSFNVIFVRTLTINDIVRAKLDSKIPNLLTFKNVFARRYFSFFYKKRILLLTQYAIEKSIKKGEKGKDISVLVNKDYQQFIAGNTVLHKNGFSHKEIMTMSPIERDNTINSIAYLAPREKNQSKIRMLFKPISHRIKLKKEVLKNG